MKKVAPLNNRLKIKIVTHRIVKHSSSEESGIRKAAFKDNATILTNKYQLSPLTEKQLAEKLKVRKK